MNAERNYDTQYESSHVYAFDLSVEQQRIHQANTENLSPEEWDKLRLNRFIENTNTYITETLGTEKVKYDSYNLGIYDGSPAFYSRQYPGKPIREVYNPDTNDPEIEWPEYRKKGVQYVRAKIEYQTFCEFEQSDELINSKDGDIFVWVSMPPTETLASNLSFEEKKKKMETLGFGFHTNTFVIQRQGNEFNAYVVQNYLTPEGQKDFLKEATGGKKFESTPNDLDLLGNIFIAKNLESIDDVHSLIRQTASKSPHTNLIPEFFELSRDLTRNPSNERIANALGFFEPMIEEVYFLLKHSTKQELGKPEFQKLISDRFTGWENIIKLHLENKLNDIPEIVMLDTSAIETLAKAELNSIRTDRSNHTSQAEEMPDSYREQLDFFAQQITQQNATGCGLGVGCSTNGVQTLTLTYTAVEKFGKTIVENVPCKFCKKIVDAEISGGRIYCPKCEKSAKKPDSIRLPYAA